METTVVYKTAPSDIKDNSSSSLLVNYFHLVYYDLAGFANVNKILLPSQMDVSHKSNLSVVPIGNFKNSYIQYPKLKFLTFSGKN